MKTAVFTFLGGFLQRRARIIYFFMIERTKNQQCRARVESVP